MSEIISRLMSLYRRQRERRGDSTYLDSMFYLFSQLFLAFLLQNIVQSLILVVNYIDLYYFLLGMIEIYGEYSLEAPNCRYFSPFINFSPRFSWNSAKRNDRPFYSEGESGGTRSGSVLGKELILIKTRGRIELVKLYFLIFFFIFTLYYIRDQFERGLSSSSSSSSSSDEPAPDEEKVFVKEGVILNRVEPPLL